MGAALCHGELGVPETTSPTLVARSRGEAAATAGEVEGEEEGKVGV